MTGHRHSLFLALTYFIQEAVSIPCTPDLYFPHPMDCSAFYLCGKDSNPHMFSCPGDLVFNTHKHSCDWPSNVPCEGGVRTEVISRADNAEGYENGEANPDPENAFGGVANGMVHEAHFRIGSSEGDSHTDEGGERNEDPEGKNFFDIEDYAPFMPYIANDTEIKREEDLGYQYGGEGPVDDNDEFKSSHEEDSEIRYSEEEELRETKDEENLSDEKHEYPSWGEKESEKNENEEVKNPEDNVGESLNLGEEGERNANEEGANQENDRQYSENSDEKSLESEEKSESEYSHGGEVLGNEENHNSEGVEDERVIPDEESTD